MRNFNDAATNLENEFNKFTAFTKIEDLSNRKKYNINIHGEDVKVLLLKTTLTSSDRSKPQVRVITDKILELTRETVSLNEKQFCFIYCEHNKDELKLSTIEPRDYIVSLESDWKNAGGRIDVRSVYDWINGNPTLNFKKINKSQHSARSILQATFFKETPHGFENIENYLSFFDSRLISIPDESESESVGTLESVGINKIYFGAPGTGKSYGIQKFIKENGIPDYEDILSHPNIFRTTLHPEFTYYDFVGQVMPKVIKSSDPSVENRIEYDFAPSIFTKALKFAESVGGDNSEPVFLILEEMSRANVAAVFGDIFQLLDRNVETGVSEYKINNDLISTEVYNDNRQIYIPANLFIIGTVNTNDQNVFVMDTAFKRRFIYEYVSANKLAFNEDSKVLNDFMFNLVNEDGTQQKFNWVTMYRALNSFITKKVDNGGLGLNEDKQLGQFFIKFKDADTSFNIKQIKGKLLQYLFNDVEDVAYTNLSLFKKQINNFGEAYESLETNQNIFSDEFITEYNELKKIDIADGIIDA